MVKDDSASGRLNIVLDWFEELKRLGPGHRTIDGRTNAFMGLTHVTVKVGNPANGRRTEEVRCLVDSGAIYSLVPRPVLRRLGIKAHSTREFFLANGDAIRRRLHATSNTDAGDSMDVGEPGDDACSGTR